MSSIDFGKMVARLDGLTLGEDLAHINAIANIELNDQNEEKYGIEVAGGKVKVHAGGVAKPTFTVSTDSNAISRIISGELNPMTAYMSGDIRVEGDLASIMSSLPAITSLLKK